LSGVLWLPFCLFWFKQIIVAQAQAQAQAQLKEMMFD
jgi:hypothetical protein